MSLYPVSDLATFAELELESDDIDPLYPVLKYLEKDMPVEQALWCTFLYLAYYNLASSWEVFCAYPHPVPELDRALCSLPTGVERRNLRGGRPMAYHLASLYQIQEAFGGFDPWLRFHLKEPHVEDAKRQNWSLLFYVLQHPWGNGRWASYKGDEVLMKVHGFPLEATDMGNAFSSGPRQGLAMFRPNLPKGNGKATIQLLDAFAEDLRAELRVFHQVTVGIEQLETLLCNMHSMAAGKYYPGHDIDDLGAQVAKSKRPDLMAPLWAARKAVLPNHWLGELNGWDGPDKRRMKVYKNMGRIIAR